MANELRARLIAALRAFEYRLGGAWQADCKDGISDKRLKEEWAKADAGRAALIALIEEATPEV